MLFDKVYFDSIKQELLHKGTMHLYTLPKLPKRFAIGDSLEDCTGEHEYKTQEHRYGKAIMITKICVICAYGQVEVFPPNENRMVIQ